MRLIQLKGDNARVKDSAKTTSYDINDTHGIVIGQAILENRLSARARKTKSRSSV